MKKHPANILFPVITAAMIASSIITGHKLTWPMLPICIIAINLTTFLLYWLDKNLAKTKTLWRIPQWLLLLTMPFGGLGGAFVGIHILRHKSKTPVFIITEITTAIVGIALYFLLK
ncbi:MAG: DUF1294 domain-containing protein [Phycisphaerae bacterium]|nr:DUF1294 domain-containing protein [Phycisphaerae bacterium]